MELRSEYTVPKACRCAGNADNTLPELGEMVRNSSMAKRSSRVNAEPSVSSGPPSSILANLERTVGSPVHGSRRAMTW